MKSVCLKLLKSRLVSNKYGYVVVNKCGRERGGGGWVVLFQFHVMIPTTEVLPVEELYTPII